jgi:hypothetical protein
VIEFIVVVDKVLLVSKCTIRPPLTAQIFASRLLVVAGVVRLTYVIQWY